jgi:hypothetical protein
MEILSIAVATLVVLVLAHFAVYYVVRTLYPPAQPPTPAPAPAPAPAPVFTQPPIVEQQQHVVIPTYEASMSVETTRKEGSTPIGELQGPTIQRDTGLDAAHP